jgi:hypothetical protein|tara:strand:- start:209 stop:493 length:285 start_codon:yes stop_codon:yes gene_type:complete
MTEQQWLNLALASMHTGQWFGFKKDWTGEHRMSYENIIVHDSSIVKPTEAQVNAKVQELKDAETANTNARTTGKAKLKSGDALTDAEIKALFGE